MKISIWRKIKLFLFFRRVLKNNKNEIQQIWNARIDRASRIYTVLNIPDEYFSEPYNIKKSDIDIISESFITEYSTKIKEYLNSKGLSELFSLYEIRKVGKYNYLYVIGFSLLDSKKFLNNIFFKIVPIIILLLTFFIIYKLS